MRPLRLVVLTSVPLSFIFAVACGDDGAQALAFDAGLADSPFSSDAGSYDGPDDSGADAATTPSTPSIGFTGASGAAITSIRYGEQVVVHVRGLAPRASIVIEASSFGARATAEFAASADGEVDVGRDAPTAGDYRGVDADGLFWGMRATPGAPETFDVSFVVRDAAGVTLATAVLERRALDDGLTIRDVREDAIVGRWFAPAGSGRDAPRPAVLVLGGSEGGLDGASFDAAYLASRGYVALALAYFGIDPLPSSLSRIPLEYFDVALAWLAAQPGVDASRLAVYGGSRGGELALELGARFPDVHAVVAVVPSGVRWPSVYDRHTAAFTYEAVDLPFVPSAGIGAVRETLPDGGVGHRLAPQFTRSLDAAPPEAVVAATIEVEHTNGPVLLVGGSDDGIWDSCLLAGLARDRLDATGHASAHADEYLCLDGAGHLIGPPGSPTADGGRYAYSAGGLAGTLILGGTPEGQGRGDRRFDTALFAFLARALGPAD